MPDGVRPKVTGSGDAAAPRPPLAEALVEVRWKLLETPGLPPGEFSSDPSYPLLVGVLFERIKDRFPQIEELPSSAVPDQMTPYIVKYRFRSSTRSPSIQLGPGVATVNYATGYTWPDFRETVLAFIPALRQAYESTGNTLVPTSVVLRYINTVEFNSAQDDALTFLGEQLHVQIRLPEAIVADERRNGMPGGVVMRVGLPLSKPRSVAALQVGTGKHLGVPSILWDLSVSSKDALAPTLSAQFEDWLTQAHDVMESWFFSMIRGTLDERFGMSGV
jgi:uncharacterized protein (TIGR04255 family)